ncbi:MULTISPECIES: HEPN domain-containing protein [unclassified Leptolyngbya]|uniref:HEPN domain-containing protein n=1 Tax=unclassified Leptolyngbya TaxID=2650499 RepID=UPI001687CDB8|nr:MULTISPECIES: HEPN domain-containing protein [unclassified Leptolyngbya]MBD1911714.1 hypothetical protein [Leptolyngbya sp. FACHB-8]MBD2155549.1 hypothetical protein [Leptolyngbya sp. FACHB-16]
MIEESVILQRISGFLNTLKEFVLNCKNTRAIDCGKYQGNIRLASNVVVEVKATNVSYEEGKLRNLKLEQSVLFGPHWGSVEYIFEDCILNSDEYLTLLNDLENLYQFTEAQKNFPLFVRRVIRTLLEGEQDTDEKLNELSSLCLNSFYGRPFKYGSESFIYGIELELGNIQLEVHQIKVRISKLTNEDFEFKGSVDELIKLEKERNFAPRIPLAKLEVEFDGFSRGDIYPKTQKIITALRLFRVGSVDYNCMREYSNSLTDEEFLSLNEYGYKTATIKYFSNVGNLNRAFDTYQIKEEELPSLEAFLGMIYLEIPHNFYGGDLKKNYLSISYDRYVTALLDGQSLEYRIASAVMGLESIYLTESMELKYRLSVRAARVLSIWSDKNSNFSPGKIKLLISYAYDIRSAFVHGDEPNKDLPKKIKNYVPDINHFLLVILGYLRISIALHLMLKISKKDFVAQIDNSLIDDDCLYLLKEKILAFKEVIPV